MARLWLVGLCAAAALGACTSIWAVDEEGNAIQPPQAVERAPTAPPARELPPPQPGPAPAPAPSAAPGVSIAPPAEETAAEAEPDAPPPPTTRTARDDPNRVVVRGVRERPVPPPNGDPRSTSERMADIRAWDECVMRLQNAAEADPLRPMLDTPEDVCRQRLGMSSRQGIPDSRRNP